MAFHWRTIYADWVGIKKKKHTDPSLKQVPMTDMQQSQATE